MPKFKYPAKPKAPRNTAPKSSHDKFADKMADWQKKCKEIDDEKKAHAAAVKRTQDLKNGKKVTKRARA